MAKLGAMSLARLGECHINLRRLVKAYVQSLPATRDIIVLCGYRDKTAQHIAFTSGKSKLDWPNSKHNQFPSRAVDIAPYPIDWKNEVRFLDQREELLLLAHDLEIPIRVISWDLPHFELRDDLAPTC